MNTHTYTFYPNISSFPLMDIEARVKVKYSYTPAEPQTWADSGCEAEVEIISFLGERSIFEDDALALIYNSRLQKGMDFDHLKEDILENHDAEIKDNDAEYEMECARDRDNEHRGWE